MNILFLSQGKFNLKRKSIRQEIVLTQGWANYGPRAGWHGFSPRAVVCRFGLTGHVCVSLQCSVSCGSGEQTRSVTCVGSDGLVLQDSSCGTLLRPPAVQPCVMPACPRHIRWHVGPWGLVSARRDVFLRRRFCWWLKTRLCFSAVLQELRLRLTGAAGGLLGPGQEPLPGGTMRRAAPPRHGGALQQPAVPQPSG